MSISEFPVAKRSAFSSAMYASVSDPAQESILIDS
jgi:hypothetical protein